MNREQAIGLMPPSSGQSKRLHADGITNDIMHSIMRVYRESNHQAQALGKSFAQGNEMERVRNVFAFVKRFVAYQLDPAGVQNIPEPSRTVAQGYSDCKGYAILTSALLNHAGVSTMIRFVSFKNDNKPTHVYTVARLKNGQLVAVDPCLASVGQEQPHTFQRDYMAQINQISGPATDYVASPTINPEESDAITELKLHREAAALEGAIASSIGSPDGQFLKTASEEAQADYDAAIRYAVSGNYAMVGAVGDYVGKRKGGKQSRRKRRGQLIKRVAKVAKQAGKTAFRAVTLPQRLAVKGILEVLLPRAAYFFIYLFITNATTLANLPGRVKRKRKTQERIAKFITGVIGFKEARFMKIVRNGIMRKYKQQPEKLLAAQISAPITGAYVGIIADGLAAGKIVVTIIEKLVKLFGKKQPDAGNPEDDAADLEGDFSDATIKQKRLVKANLSNKTKNELQEEPADQEQSSKETHQQNRAVEQVEAESEDTPEEAEIPEAVQAAQGTAFGFKNPFDYLPNKGKNNSKEQGRKPSGNQIPDGVQPRGLDDIPDDKLPQNGSNNNSLLIAGAVILGAVVLQSSQTKKRK